MKRLGQRLNQKGQFSYEMEILAKDGHRVTLEVNTRLTYQDGKPNGIRASPAILRNGSVLKQNARSYLR